MDNEKQPVLPQHVLVKKDHQGIMRVTLNRPEKHNAFDDSIIKTLTDTFKRIADDHEIRVVVLAAQGKSFSAGGDLNWMKRVANYSQEENQRDAQALAELLLTLNTLPQPTICRVQGSAFGGAVGLISCCDIAIATPAARFCLSEVKVGLMPATISPYVINAMGARAARRYFLTAEVFDAPTAKNLQLINEIVSDEQLDSTVNELAAKLLGNGPQAIGATKQLIFDVASRVIDQNVINDTVERIAKIRVSPEGQEGLGAFLEKRRPAWAIDLDKATDLDKRSGQD